MDMIRLYACHILLPWGKLQMKSNSSVKELKSYFSGFMRYAVDTRHSFYAEMENLTKGNNAVNKL